MEKMLQQRDTLTRKYPMIRYFTDRPFGIEVEFYGLDYLITPVDGSIIKPYNVRTRAVDDRWFTDLVKDAGVDVGISGTQWHLTEDSSIQGRGGAELVSPVLKGIDGLADAYRAINMLGALKGVMSNNTCGFHVHHGVDRESFGCEEIRNLVRLVQPLEENIYLLMPEDRRNNPTCRPVEIDVKSFLEKCDAGCNDNHCRIKELWYSERNQFCPDAARFPRYDKTRYHGLNLHSYWYRSTIEFRHHSGVLEDKEEAMQWVIFTQVLVEVAQGNIPALPLKDIGNKWMELLAEMFATNGY